MLSPEEMTAVEAIDEQRCAALLRRLVGTPSFNPPGDEAGVAAVLAEWLEREGLEPVLEEAAPDRPNLSCSYGDPQGPVVLLNGHMDTMPAGPGWKRDPFAASEEDGRVYGLGACDMKAGLAAMVEAVCAIRRSGVPLGGCVVLDAVIDEEVSGAGTRHSLRVGRRADWAVVAEPTELQVVAVGTGQVNFLVTFTGEAAHGSTPDAGRNAIYDAVDLVRRIEAENAALGARGHPKIGPPSYSVGRIEGGVRTSIVPASCSVGVDRRILPGETVADAVADLDRLLEETRSVRGASVERVVEIEYEPLQTPEDSAFAAALHEVGIALVSDGVSFAGMRGTTDAVFITETGTPTVVFGPGSMAQAHRPEEFVDLGQLRDATRVLAAATVRLLGIGPSALSLPRP